MPELFVGISSALEKSPLLSLGNIIGANILNLTLVTGLIILAGRGLKIKSKETKKDALLMLIPVAALIVLSFIGNSLSRIDGATLVCMFFIYSYRLIKQRKQEFKEKLENEIKRYDIVINSMLFVVSLLLMFYSSKLVVHYAILLSQALKVPTIAIGLFLISIGTVLPELTFGISAALKNKGEMALGDQIGTIVVNSTFIIGIVAIIQPIKTSMMIFMISAAFLLFSAFIFATFFQVSRKLYVIEAIALIFLYLLFVFVEVYARFL